MEVTILLSCLQDGYTTSVPASAGTVVEFTQERWSDTMGKKQMKTVALSELEKAFDAPSALTTDSAPVEVVAVTMAPEVPAPQPVKRKLTAEEQANHEKLWKAVHDILTQAIQELKVEGAAALKEEQRLADIKAFHDASYGPVQDYWTKRLEEVAKESAEKEAERKETLAQLEAAVRARKSRQEAHRDERAEANRQRAGKGAGGNGNGKKGK